MKRPAMLGGIAAILAAAIAVPSAVAIASHGTAGTIRLSGIPANVSTSLADLMSLSPVPPAAAPGYALTDQEGRGVTAAALRGKVVVLEFMDPHCTDICPIVSQEFIGAYHALGPLASKVVFVAINVNPYHLSVADVAAFSAEQRLTTIPAWHFLTGPLSRLQAAWRAYNIAVQAPNPDADVVHTSTVYFIAPDGTERYIAEPMDDHTANGTAYLPANQIAAWAHGIALIARDLAR